MSTVVAVPSAMPGGLDAQMGMHFGHCDIYTIVEIEDNKIKSVADLALAFDPEKLKTLNLSGNSEINDWSKITTIYKSVTGKPSSSESSEASSDSSDTSK